MKPGTEKFRAFLLLPGFKKPGNIKKNQEWLENEIEKIKKVSRELSQKKTANAKEVRNRKNARQDIKRMYRSAKHAEKNNWKKEVNDVLSKNESD